MSDRLVRGLLPSQGVRAVHVRVTETARIARMLHGLYPTAAHLFGVALAAGALLASLQKERGRVNLQIECDGPVGGLFVDADPDGNVRGYVRRPAVHFPGDPVRAARAALGGSGSPTFLFKQNGEKLTGTYNGLFGTAQLTGTVKGDAIEFSFEVTLQDQKGKIVYTGKIQSATKMAGDADLAGLGKGKWTGTKAD